MKTIALPHYQALVNEAIAGAEQTAKLRKEQFTGITSEALSRAVQDKVGDSYVVKKAAPQITEEDFKTMANGRFQREMGVKLLGGWMIGVLAMLQVGVWLPMFQPTNYIAGALLTIAFAVIYARKQKQAYQQFRKDLWGEK